MTCASRTYEDKVRNNFRKERKEIPAARQISRKREFCGEPDIREMCDGNVGYIIGRPTGNPYDSTPSNIHQEDSFAYYLSVT